jgi:hypothetical protein
LGFSYDNFDDHAVQTSEIHAPPVRHTIKPAKTSFPAGFDLYFAGTAAQRPPAAANSPSATRPPPRQNRSTAISKTEKPNATLLLLVQLLKFPVKLFAYGKKPLNRPQPLIYNDHLTPYEDKDKREKQEIDDPKKF